LLSSVEKLLWQGVAKAPNQHRGGQSNSPKLKRLSSLEQLLLPLSRTKKRATAESWLVLPALAVLYRSALCAKLQCVAIPTDAVTGFNVISVPHHLFIGSIFFECS
jgi:hypothetical protein